MMCAIIDKMRIQTVLELDLEHILNIHCKTV